MTRLVSLLVAAMAFGILASPARAAAPAPTRPNIVFVLTDDQGWGDAAAWGHPYVKTPNLDRLTRESTRFTQFYAANPVCSPSRTAFMTGRYPARFGIHGHLAERELNTARDMPHWLDPKATTLPRLLQTAGYKTGHFGKWHLGSGEGAPEPGAYGIDTSATIVSNGPQIGDKESRAKPHWWGRSTTEIMDHALGFIRENQQQPFYVNIWTLVPHARLDPTPEQLAVYADLNPRPDHPAFGHWAQQYYKEARDLRSQMQVFLAALTDLDTQVGRLLTTLRELGLEENTLVVFSSDNGPEDYGISNATNAGVGSPGPLRARKRAIYEGGVGVPLLVRWPGKVPAGRLDETSVVGAVDFLPTVCALTGVKPQTDTPVDGEDVSDILLSGRSRPRRGPLFWEWRFRVFGLPDFTPPTLAVRDGDWKLLLNPDRSRVELYDIPKDRSEDHNLAQQHPDVVERLAKAAVAWKATLPPDSGDYEERMAALRRAKAKPGKPGTDRAALFEKVDKDHDGQLSAEEFLSNFTSDPEEGRRRFKLFDTNQDGVLSREEFLKMGGR